MHTHTDKKTGTESNAVANGLSVYQNSDPKSFQLKNKRPEALTQRKIQEIINDSEQVNQLKIIQSLADSKGAKQLRTEKAVTTTAVVQRTPKTWETHDVIVRALALERSGFREGSSTWEKIKTAIINYKALGTDEYEEYYNHEKAVIEIFKGRTGRLNIIKQLIIKWHTDHPVSYWNGDKVKNIRALLPELEEAVRDEEDDIIGERFANKFLNERPPLVVPPELSDGVGAQVGDAAKALKLHQNFNNNLRFRYTGKGAPAEVGLAAHQGDCGTLANIYIAVANSLGIPAVLADRPGKQLVAAQPIKGRTTTGNTHDQGAWFFQQHFWAVVAGTSYDILFMQTPPPVAITTNGSAQYKGVHYCTFPDNRCVIEATEKNKFNDPAVIKGEGRVFADVAAAQLFIDGNVPG
jgi:Transglutaminase-like superfamily